VNITIDLDGTQETIRAFERVQGGIADLRKNATWLRVRQAFYRVQKDIFAGEGPGWKELSSPYKEIKAKRWGNKPILQASGKMYREFTVSPGMVDAQATEMTLGFSQPAGYHMSKKARSKMPYRSSLDLTDAQEKEILKPIGDSLKQLVANARLRDLRG
jgi:phage gpG-like protein